MIQVPRSFLGDIYANLIPAVDEPFRNREYIFYFFPSLPYSFTENKILIIEVLFVPKQCNATNDLVPSCLLTPISYHKNRRLQLVCGMAVKRWLVQYSWKYIIRSLRSKSADYFSFTVHKLKWTKDNWNKLRSIITLL